MSTAASPPSVPRTPSSGVRRHQSYADRDRYQTTPTRSGAQSSPRRSVSQSQAPSHSRNSSTTAQGQLQNVARREFEQTNVARPSSSSQPNDEQDSTALPNRSDSTRQPSIRPAPHSRFNSQDMPTAVPVNTNGSGVPDTATATHQTTSGVRRRTTIDATTGHWELGKTIGAGSMGKVKLAKQKETGEQVRTALMCHDIYTFIHS